MRTGRDMEQKSLNMRVVLVGLNHKTAPLHIREQISFVDNNVDNSYSLLKIYPHIVESFMLSTCNRVELYGAGYDGKKVADELEDFLYKTHEVRPGSLGEYLYRKMDAEAIRHLFRVASGLDSMIIGENQILGQIKMAYEKAKVAGSVGFHLHKLLQNALRIGKKVRSLTNISKGVASIPGAVLELIKKEKYLSSKKVLVIGAGKMGRMTVARLAKSGIREVVVINRDKSRAENLEKDGKVRVESFSALKDELLVTDIIIAVTASIDYIITREMIEELFREKRGDLLLIDLGVPRNIEESVRDIVEVRLYNIDDLGIIIEETMRNRTVEAEKAEEIIRDQVCERSFSGSDKAY